MSGQLKLYIFSGKAGKIISLAHDLEEARKLVAQIDQQASTKDPEYSYENPRIVVAGKGTIQ